MAVRKEITDTLMDAVNRQSEGRKRHIVKKKDDIRVQKVKAGCGSSRREEECSCKMSFS